MYGFFSLQRLKGNLGQFNLRKTVGSMPILGAWEMNLDKHIKIKHDRSQTDALRYLNAVVRVSVASPGLSTLRVQLNFA